MTAARIASFFYHELETSFPLKAAAGYFEIKGWCMAPGLLRPPMLQLRAGAKYFEVSSRIARADVLAIHHGVETALACGFIIEGRIEPGVYLATLEASSDGQTWSYLREFTLIATSAELQFSIEWPTTPCISESVRVQGWCLHPDFPLREIALHYGNKKIACEYGSPRKDVRALFPHVSHAANTGFIATKNLPVSRGPLRIRAVGENGQVCHATTNVEVNISVDEEHPKPLKLASFTPDLGSSKIARTVTQSGRASHPRRILFVLYGDFTSNSAFHVTQLANELIAQGHECIVTVPHHAETIAYQPSAQFQVILFTNYQKNPAAFKNSQTADVVHAWTTRENVRHFCKSISAGYSSSLVIHLEDHEQRILESTLNRSHDTLIRLPQVELDALVPETLSHPLHSQDFLQKAQGVTVILERLLEFVPAGKPHQVIWPAANKHVFFPRPIPYDYRRALKLDDHTILFYHGNVHVTNQAEVRELYLAVLKLNETGVPTTLIRTGRDFCDFIEDLKERLSPYLIHLGQVDHQHHLPPLMALADYFVQPGESDTFNDYRFPSKLPEFFAIGRPVILPRTNLGEKLRHLEDAFILEKADASGIAAAVIALRADPALREKLSINAVRFSETHFSWARSAALLNDFYNRLPSIT